MPYHHVANSALRRRSPSPDFNEPSDEAELQLLMERQPAMKKLVLFRKLEGVAWARDFDNGLDVTLGVDYFAKEQMFANCVPGFQLYVVEKGAASKVNTRSVIETQLEAQELIQGFGLVSVISKTSCDVTAFETSSCDQPTAPRRYNAPNWCCKPMVALGSDMAISDTCYHFMALPTVTADITLKKSRQKPLPLIFGMHEVTKDCSPMVKHDPRHWFPKGDNPNKNALDRLTTSVNIKDARG